MLFAPTCAGCGAEGVELCPDCLGALRPAPAIPPPAGLDGFASVFAYEGIGRQLVLGLKYRNRHGDLAVLGPALAEAAAEVLAALDAVPVITWAPTTPRRRRRRGYDQARWLARALGAAVGARARPLLVRLPSEPQTGASRSQRLAGPAFVCARRVVARVPSVLVVDDVCTSGATLTAAATALRASGSENVVAVTLAQTSLNQPPRPAETLRKPACGSWRSGWIEGPAVQPTNTQVERSLAALRDGAPAHEVVASEDELRTTDLPDGLVERIQRTPGVRPDRLEEARERMESGDEPSADDLASRMVGRLVCDRLR